MGKLDAEEDGGAVPWHSYDSQGLMAFNSPRVTRHNLEPCTRSASASRILCPLGRTADHSDTSDADT